MFESFRDDRRRAKGSKQKPVRLFVEELEGRCLLSGGVNPIGGITVGPNGNLWFSEPGKIGDLNPSTGIIQETNLPAGPSYEGQITFDKNGNLWFTRIDRVDEMDPATGSVREFFLPSGDSARSNVAIGGDGKVWFCDGAGALRQLDPNTGDIIRVFPSHDSVWGWHHDYGQVFGGPDGGIWVGDIAWDDTSGYAPDIFRMDRIDSSGNQQFSIPIAGGITVGPDGSLWCSFWVSYQIAWIDQATGALQIVPNGAAGGLPLQFLTIGSNGNVWAIGGNDIYRGNDIYQINVGTGAIQEFLIPQSKDFGLGITAGKDGNIWFSEPNAIGQFNPTTGAFQFFDTAAESATQGLGSTYGSSNSISATGTSVFATAGIDFMGVVALFANQVPVASHGAAYQATIDWGDGTTSSLVLTATENATYDVTAGHTYQTAGTYSIKVTIGNYNPANPLGDDAVTVFSMANVDPFNFTM